MVDCCQLHDFRMRHYPSQTLILMRGECLQRYYEIIREAFPNCSFSKLFEDKFRPDYWCTYARNLDNEGIEDVKCLLELFTNTVFIDDALSQTFALDYHMQPGEGRTEIGQLVYQSKPYNRPVTDQHKQSALDLAGYFEEFIRQHPTYLSADFIISVPSNKRKPFDLPNFIVQELSQRLSIQSGQTYIHKIKKTTPMKDVQTIQDKIANIEGAFEVANTHPFSGKSVLIVDDIYASGMTLHELATTLQNVNAQVLGLVATKTFTDI